MRFLPQCLAMAVLMGLIYPLYGGIVWNSNFGLQGWLETSFGAPFHDFAGSIVVHAIGGWIALALSSNWAPGLVAVCAGSDIFHPIGALIVGAIFVKGYSWCQERLKIDDFLDVWPLHGLCGLWSGIAAGIFGLEVLGGLGGVSIAAQIAGSLFGIAYATAAGFLVHGILKALIGLRLSEEDEMRGANLSIHHIGANPEAEIQGV